MSFRYPLKFEIFGMFLLLGMLAVNTANIGRSRPGFKSMFPKQFCYLPRGSLGKCGLFQGIELFYDVNGKPLENKNTFIKMKKQDIQKYLRLVEFCYKVIQICYLTVKFKKVIYQ